MTIKHSNHNLLLGFIVSASRSVCFRSGKFLMSALLFVILLQAMPKGFLQIHVAFAEDKKEQITKERIIDTGLLTIFIYTENREFPTFMELDAPEGMAGSSIKGNAYVQGYCEIYNLDSAQRFASRMKLKVRGNTSARLVGPEGKLPYKLVLKEAIDLLGNSHWDKRFVLLSNAGENLNTYLGFLIGQYCGMEWNPEYRYVNLVINDNYRGIYLMMPALDGTSLYEHVGKDGFLLECDAYWWKEDVHFHTEALEDYMAYTVKYPEGNRLTELRLEELRNYIETFDQRMMEECNSDGVDWNTFVSWILTRDITGAQDAPGGNIYYYMDLFDQYNSTDRKLKMGPLWDFDGSFEKLDSWSENHYALTTYFPYLFNDESFINRYKDSWVHIFPGIYETMDEKIKELVSTSGQSIDDSRKIDSIRWERPLKLIEDESVDLLRWLKERISWIDMELDAEFSGEHVKNVVYADVSDDCKSMDIQLVDDGYESVQFPVWSETGGQDDLIWWEASLNEDGIWQCTVDLTKHNSKGIFYIHAYECTADSLNFIEDTRTVVRRAVK